jgi:site-specific DNA-cytosine methylase
LGFEVISVDIDKTWKPDICSDICNLKAIDIYAFCNTKIIDVVWASPDCSQYSHVRNCMPHIPPNIKKSNTIVLSTLKLIKKLNPDYWFLENPATGRLKNQFFMELIPYKDCCYCRYNKDIPFRKHTRIWGNGVSHWKNPKMCKIYSNINEKAISRRLLQLHGKSCNYYRTHGSHKYSVAGHNRRNTETSNLSRTERLKIPKHLLKSLLKPLINKLVHKT